MTLHSESHIIFYSFIGCIIGVGLFFSRSMDKDADHYFWAGMSNGGGMIAFSLFLFTLLNALIIVLPGFSLQSSSIFSVVVVSIAFIIPFLFIKKIMSFIGQFFVDSPKVITVFVNILVLIFLCLMQLLVLVQITDFVIIQFFGSTQYTMLVVVIVAAGMYTMAGGLNSVLYSNMIVGSFSLISILLIFLNSILFQQPLFFSFKNIMQFGAEIFRQSGMTEDNIMIVLAGIVLMMFWMVWMGTGGVYAKISEATKLSFKKKLFVTGSMLAVTMFGILLLSFTSIEAVPDSASTASGALNYFIAVSFLGGLMGIFAITFQMVGSITAVRLYPYFKQSIEDEEQILVSRLSVIFVVLLSIIFISFAKVSGYRTFIWYINFIAFFFTPIIAALISTVAAKRGSMIGFIVGILTGEIYAIVELIGQQGEVHSSLFHSVSAYAFAVEIALVTFFAGVVSSKASEMVIVQRMVSRMKVSRSTPM